MTEAFEIVGKIHLIQTIAVGNGIREISRLRATYGHGRWRKRKGVALVSFPDGKIHHVEVHWFEAHCMGRGVKDQVLPGLARWRITTQKVRMFCVLTMTAIQHRSKGARSTSHSRTLEQPSDSTYASSMKRARIIFILQSFSFQL